jgi:hypothetical protein
MTVGPISSRSTSPEDALDNTNLSFEDLIAALGVGAKKETLYNVGIAPGRRPGSATLDQRTLNEVLASYRNLPSDEIARYQLALKKMGFKTEATGRLDTNTQVKEYFKGILTVVDAYSQLLETADPEVLSKAPSIAQFFNDSAAAGSAGKASTTTLESIYLTDEADAIQYFNNLYRTYTGAEPPVSEARKFAQRLRKREQASVQRQTTTTRDGVTRTVVTKSGFDDLDREELALSLIEKKLTSENLITMGGQIGANLKTIDGLLKAYNVTLDPNSRRTYLLDSLKAKNGLEDVTNRIKNLAAIQYPSLAPYFEQGYSPSEIFGGYLNVKSQLYGQPNLSPDPWTDRDVNWLAQKDKLPTYQEWETYLSNSPEAEYTTGFRQRAANYALEIGKLLGLA